MTAVPVEVADAATPRGSRLRRVAPFVLLAAALLVLAVVFSRPPPSGLPLDPRSSDSDGTRALTLVLDRLGARVQIFDELPAPAADVVLVLVDRTDAASAEQLRDHARGGGVLVVTDPGGNLSPALPVAASNRGLFDAALTRGCELPTFADAHEARVGYSSLLEVPAGAVGCYRRDELSWLVAEPLGTGTLVTTGGPAFLTNALLGEADNAVLAAALLAPERGTRVAVLAPTFASAGDDAEPDSLGDLIPLYLKLGALQLVVAFGCFALWRARRLGRPVREPQEVRLPGSELVVAVGNLYHRTGARARAVELLQADVRRTLAERLGVEHDTDPQQLAEAAAARTSATAAEVLGLLAGPPPASDTELVAFAQRAEALRHAVLAPAPPASVPVAAGAARADRQ